MKYNNLNFNKTLLRSFVLIFFITASFFVSGKAFASFCDFDRLAWGGGGYRGGEEERESARKPPQEEKEDSIKKNLVLGFKRVYGNNNNK